MFVNLPHLEDIFAFSKQFEPNSTKHTDKTIWNGSCGWQLKSQTQYMVVKIVRAGAAAPALGFLLLSAKQLSDTAVQRIRKRARF